MTDRVGQHLGNYRLTRLLGEGGFAEVYLGEHTLLGTTAAIKILHTRVAQEEVTQFQQEARLLASLKHPHIVRVLEFGIEGQLPYLVMDYAPNGTLRARHQRGTPLPVTTVVDYIKQVAQGLQYAHERKIIHRDIKPANMLLDEHGTILLSDFGIALIAQSSRYQNTTNMVGTITYMAPEQIAGHPRTASDQYALGIVAYEWLCGKRPFQGSFTEIAVQYSVTPPPSLREHMPTLSPDIERVVLTALAKQPEGRFASVKAFANALEQASQDLLPTERMRPAASLSTLLSSVPFPAASTITPHPLSAQAPSPNQPATPSQTPPTPINPSAPLFSVSTPPLQQPPVLAPPSSQTTTPPLAPTPRTRPPSSLPTPVTPIPSTQPQSPSPVKTTNTGSISRRAVLIGAAGIVAVAGVGTGVFVMTRQLTLTRVPTPTPTPTPVPQGQLLFTYKGHSNGVQSVAWSPDGQHIAFGSNTVQVWNASDGSRVFTYNGHSEYVDSVAWSPNGQRIASGSADNTVQVWNASDGSRAFTYNGHSYSVKSVAWSPDGQRIASGSADNTVQVWNASDRSRVFTYNGHSGHSYGVWSVAWSPDGQHIASSSYNDKTVQVWNASDGNRVFSTLLMV